MSECEHGREAGTEGACEDKKTRRVSGFASTNRAGFDIAEVDGTEFECAHRIGLLPQGTTEKKRLFSQDYTGQSNIHVTKITSEPTLILDLEE